MIFVILFTFSESSKNVNHSQPVLCTEPPENAELVSPSANLSTTKYTGLSCALSDEFCQVK